VNLQLFAKALAVGIEQAALTNHENAKTMLLSRKSWTTTLRGSTNDDSVDVELRAVQQLTDHVGDCIEMVAIATDGKKELKAYFYVRAMIPDAG
jgi:hypothetical protein